MHNVKTTPTRYCMLPPTGDYTQSSCASESQFQRIRATTMYLIVMTIMSMSSAANTMESFKCFGMNLNKN